MGVYYEGYAMITMPEPPSPEVPFTPISLAGTDVPNLFLILLCGISCICISICLSVSRNSSTITAVVTSKSLNIYISSSITQYNSRRSWVVRTSALIIRISPIGVFM